MVPPPPRRHAQVRREPAQALPGHLQRELGVGGLARPLAGAARRRAALGRPRREGVPRRQPAHQAVRVLGVADRRGARARSRRGLPRRGVHPPGRDAPAGQARLQPVLHLLHLEELALGADRVRHRAGLLRRAGVLPAELLRQHAGHPPRVPPARRPGRVRGAPGARGDAQPELRDLLGLRALRERPAARGHRGVPRLGEVRGQEALARRAAAAADPAPERDPARQPGAAGAVQRHLPRHRQRRPDRLRQAVARRTR